MTEPVNDNFDRAFEYVLGNEGLYSNHKDDKGGPTKYGITIHTLQKWRGLTLLPMDVQNLSRTEAKEIYRKWWWDTLKCEGINSLVVATAIFDAGVLFGVPMGARTAQRALVQAGFAIREDGIVGPVTLDALNAIQPSLFIIAFRGTLERLVSDIVAKKPANSVFLGGWENRIKRMSTLIA